MLPSLSFVRQRYSPGQSTFAIYEAPHRYPTLSHPCIGWVDVDWNDIWHVARNIK